VPWTCWNPSGCGRPRASSQPAVGRRAAASGHRPGGHRRPVAAAGGRADRRAGAGLPVTRSPGGWPDRSGFDQLISLFYIITVLAVLSALFLIASTMNTLMVEQAAEIATKAVVRATLAQLGAEAVSLGQGRTGSAASVSEPCTRRRP
jgi:hypothetical protein